MQGEEPNERQHIDVESRVESHFSFETELRVTGTLTVEVRPQFEIPEETSQIAQAEENQDELQSAGLMLKTCRRHFTLGLHPRKAFDLEEEQGVDEEEQQEYTEV